MHGGQQKGWLDKKDWIEIHDIQRVQSFAWLSNGRMRKSSVAFFLILQSENKKRESFHDRNSNHVFAHVK
jgi:hypothetical protein